MPASPPIETTRLRLRAVRDDDAPALHAIQADREAMRFTHSEASLERYREHLRAHERTREQLGFAPWTVVHRPDDRIVGWGGLNVDPFAEGWGVEVSYFLDRAVWGRGLATELVRASIAHGFGDLALDRIGAFAMPANQASIRVLVKCGFALLGYEPQLERNQYEIQRSAWIVRC